MMNLQACQILGRASNLIGVLRIVTEMATIRKTLLISLKSRLCKETIITKNLLQLLQTSLLRLVVKAATSPAN
jgi:hypothetical protein